MTISANKTKLKESFSPKKFLGDETCSVRHQCQEYWLKHSRCIMSLLSDRIHDSHELIID